ncbi:hypothetical protein FOZ63_013572, partial [Perkinsus olseni]
LSAACRSVTRRRLCRRSATRERLRTRSLCRTSTVEDRGVCQGLTSSRDRDRGAQSRRHVECHWPGYGGACPLWAANKWHS